VPPCDGDCDPNCAPDALVANHGVECVLALCDVADVAADAGERMLAYLDATILESHFETMASKGFTLVRLPLGYWNVVDLPGTGNMPAETARRWGSLQQMLPAADYLPFIERVFDYASAHGLRVLLDLHSAPGGQTGNQNTGCSTGGADSVARYFDTTYNSYLAVLAVKEMASLCKRYGNSCYGIGLLNEPCCTHAAIGDANLDRPFLHAFYRDAIAVARADGLVRVEGDGEDWFVEGASLPLEVPIVVMDWLEWLSSYWDAADFGPYEQTGQLVFESHIYTGHSTSQQESRDAAGPDFATYQDLGTRRRIFIGEFGMDANHDVNYNQLASWYVSQANQFGQGSFVWNFDGPWAWGAVVPLDLGWPQIFQGGPYGEGHEVRRLERNVSGLVHSRQA